jgi:predicted metal-dependent HD superfamily phosphohydrolase
MLSEQRFRDLWTRLGCRNDGSLQFAALERAYAEPHRAYHSTAHIEDCLQQFDWARSLAVCPDEVETAIWFHDAVYDPRSSDNEQRSAAWAKQSLVDEAEAEVAERVFALVMLTRHDAEPNSSDGELLLDIDLSILGRQPDEFALDDTQIRKEYAWVPEKEYRRRRAEVLKSFLSRPSIYRTQIFCDRFESQARTNLQAALVNLRR